MDSGKVGKTSVLEIVIGLSGVFVSEGTSSVFVSVGTSSVFVSDGKSSVFVSDGNWSVKLVVLISVEDVTGLPSVLDGGGTTSVRLSVGVVIGTSGVFVSEGNSSVVLAVLLSLENTVGLSGIFVSVKLSLVDVIGLSGVLVSEGNSSVMVVLRVSVEVNVIGTSVGNSSVVVEVLRVSVDANVIGISELSVMGAVGRPIVVVREGNVRVTGLSLGTSVGTGTDSVGCKPKGVVCVIPAESVKTISQLVDDSVVVSAGKSSVEVVKSVTEVGSSVTESEDRVRVMMCDVV